ncbi:YiiG family protein [Citrobacter sp. S2-9]|uniref:YiiG family protein n=1 Tax=Citrobacter enshiensis TaxID=2971264 RepID=A0ABT8PZ97_9ENTR|nr:YiiG family protein [Citrobacter enshiensis]MDN8601735.1 YiiG family protein [Citrobacter enshiensis]
MKRDLLSTVIGCALLLAGVVGCDDNKTAESAPVSSTASATPVPANPSTSSNVSKNEEKSTDSESIVSEKMHVYIECYNDIDETIYRSIQSYSTWLADLKKGPTGKEEYVYGISKITADLDKCHANMSEVAALKPELEPIDKAALPYINSSIDIVNVINKMNKYYEQQDYKDDAFAKGKELHTQFMQAFSAFKSTSDTYSEAIHEINDRRQAQLLKKIEAQEGKSFDYYALSIMLTSKKINQAIQSDKLDTDATMKQVQDLGEQIEQLKSKQGEAKNDSRDRKPQASTFIDAAEKYLLDAKTRVRRIRDNTPLTTGEKMLMENAPQMVDGTFEKVMDSYNQMVTWFNAMGR